MPLIEQLAEELAGLVTLAAVDAEAHPSLAQELGVQRSPTLRRFCAGPQCDSAAAERWPKGDEFCASEPSLRRLSAWALAPVRAGGRRRGEEGR